MIKVDGLITMLKQEATENPRRKHLVVSQFTKFLDLMETPIQQSGFKLVRLDGSMSMRQRTNAIESFSDISDDSPTVMLLSLKAGGVGLNLTAATRVFLMDPVSAFYNKKNVNNVRVKNLFQGSTVYKPYTYFLNKNSIFYKNCFIYVLFSVLRIIFKRSNYINIETALQKALKGSFL